jgi:hypothetical protein
MRDDTVGRLSRYRTIHRRHHVGESMKVDAVGSTILGILVIIMGTLLVAVSSEIELAPWLQWALGATTITMGLVFVLVPWIRVSAYQPQTQEFEEMIRRALTAPQGASNGAEVIESTAVEVNPTPTAALDRPHVPTPTSPTNGAAGALLLEDLRQNQLAELNSGKLKLALVWLELVAQTPEGLMDGWTRAEQALDIDGDVELPHDLQKMNDRMISLLVRANVLGKLNDPEYRSHNGVHQATGQEQVRNEILGWTSARATRVFGKWGNQSWQQGELRDIEANLFHLRQSSLAGWFGQVWIKLITDLIEESHNNKDVDAQAELLCATIIIAGVFLNYVEKYGPQYAS